MRHYATELSCTVPGCLRVFASQQAVTAHVASSLHREANETSGPSMSKQSTKLRSNEATPVKRATSNSEATRKSFGTDVADPITFANLSNTLSETGVVLEDGLFTGNQKVSPSGPYENVQQGASSGKVVVKSAVQAKTHSASHDMYSRHEINECCVIATPSNGGESFISPLVLHQSDAEYRYVLIASQSRLHDEPTDLSNLQRCKLRGVTITTGGMLPTDCNTPHCKELALQSYHEGPAASGLYPHDEPISGSGIDSET